MNFDWLFKNVRQACESLDPGRPLTMYFRIVAVECRMPNLSSNSRAMRSSPYSG